MTELSRWRTTPNPFLGGWVVRDEAGDAAPEPCVFGDDHVGAQLRADALNRAEQYTRIGAPDPSQSSTGGP